MALAMDGGERRGAQVRADILGPTLILLRTGLVRWRHPMRLESLKSRVRLSSDARVAPERGEALGRADAAGQQQVLRDERCSTGTTAASDAVNLERASSDGRY